MLPQLRGAFSVVSMDETTLYAARDPQGIRPLVLGRLERGWVVASETAALDIVGASFVREIEPGELVAIDEHGLRSQRFAEAEPKGCLFEYVYLARPDTQIGGPAVHASGSRSAAGWPQEHPAEADLVIPVPESGTPAAIGYAEAQRHPRTATGLVKNSYVGRTFIQPSQTIRQLGIRLKLNPLRDVIEGKRLVVVDDSIVRGNTQRALVRMLREAGAREVHVRISSPPVKWPCFYGIDFATRAELIANGLSVDEICRSIGADSLGYISLDELVAATERARGRAVPGLLRRRLPDRAPRAGAARQAPAGDRTPRSPSPAVPILAAPARAMPIPTPGRHDAAGSTAADALTRRARHRPVSGSGADVPRGPHVRRRGRVDRGRRQGRRADEGLGRQGPPSRGARRHRRLRRAVRRQRAQGVPPAAARDLGRRGRHQGRDRPGAWTCTTPSASTSSACSSTTSSSAAPSRCS